MSTSLRCAISFILVAIIALPLCFTIACSNLLVKENANSNALEKVRYTSKGVVTGIDKGKDQLSVDHDTIPGYMEAMEMSVQVSDPKLLDAVSVGDEISFDIERNGSDITIIRIDKTGVSPKYLGVKIFKSNCAVCHGESGLGVSGKGIPLVVGHAVSHTFDEMIDTVSNGEDDKMPPFREKLSPEDIRSVVTYVRDVIQKDADRSQHHH